MSIHSTKNTCVVVLAAVGFCITATQNLVAASPATAPNVTYIAYGIFAYPALSGSDIFKLAGQPFSINIIASEAAVPKKNGKQWAQYTNLQLTGTVYTGLEPTPISFSNGSTYVTLATGNPDLDFFLLWTPIHELGLALTITAEISMPTGTMSSAHILPFNSIVTLTPTNATVTYSDGMNSTTLGINGVMMTKVSAGGGVAALSAGYFPGLE